MKCRVGETHHLAYLFVIIAVGFTHPTASAQCSRGSVAAMIALTACWLKPL